MHSSPPLIRHFVTPSPKIREKAWFVQTSLFAGGRLTLPEYDRLIQILIHIVTIYRKQNYIYVLYVRTNFISLLPDLGRRCHEVTDEGWRNLYNL